MVCVCSSTLAVVGCFLLGFIAGFVLLLLFQWSTVPSVLEDRIADSSSTLRGSLIQQAAQNNNDAATHCVLPLGTQVVTLGKHTKNPYQLVVYREDDFLSQEIAKKGYWEIRSLQDMAQLAPSLSLPTVSNLRTQENTAFYDVGANIGYYSFLFAAAGYRVVALEPESSNLALFKASLCLNERTGISARITLLEYGLVGESSLNCTMLVGRVVPRSRKYLHSIGRLQCDPKYQCHADKDLICQRNVAVTTLPQILKENDLNLPSPDIIKIDAEGYEYPILESVFAPSVSDHRPPIQPKIIQYENRNTRAAPLIAQLLTSNGYTIGTQRGHDSNTIAEFLSR